MLLLYRIVLFFQYSCTDQLPVPEIRILGNPVPGTVVNIDQAEAVAVTAVPLKVVRQSPVEIAPDIRSTLHRAAQTAQVPGKEINPVGIVDLSVQIDPVVAAQTVFRVDALAAAAHRVGAAYLCDSVQSFGHVSQNLHKADFISLSAHKLGGPRGVGCLVVRQPSRVLPLMEGGGQEFGLRSGTENLPGIVGFYLAAQLSVRQLPEETRRLRGLSQQLLTGLREIRNDMEVAGESADRSPGILCCRFPGISGEEMVIRLGEQGICASPGAACGARSGKPSHVLLSMGYAPEKAAEFVRFSLGRGTTEEEIRMTLNVISNILR